MLKRMRSVRGEGSSSGRQAEEYDPALQLPDEWPTIRVTTAEQRQRLLNLYEREVVPSRWLHRETLKTLGLYDQVKHLLTEIGMSKFFNMHCSTFRELTCEFLSSLSVNNTRNGPVMCFRMFNKNISLTLPEFARIFELDPSLPNQHHENYKLNDIYCALTGIESTTSQHANALCFHHPVPRIFQRFGGTCVFARHEPHNAQTSELAILGHYVFGYGKLNIARFIISHLGRHANSCSTQARTPVHCGGLITRIAIKKAGFNESRPGGLTNCGGATYIDIPYLQSLFWIRTNSRGDTQWFVRVDKEFKFAITLPDPVQTSFPPGQASYTYILPDAQGGPQQPPRTSLRVSPRPSSPAQPHFEAPLPPPIVSQPMPQPETIWDFQTIGQALGRIEETQRHHGEMLGSLDQRLGYVERNQGRALFPMYDDYARRGAIPDEYVHPDWYQPPPQGFQDPSSRGTYYDYSSHAGYGQDFPFGGIRGGVVPNYFGGSSSGAGGAGGSGSAFDQMDEDADD